MAYRKTSGILFGCILLIFFQGCLSRIHSSPSRICTSQDCVVDISCMVINLEYVDCSWTRSQMQDMSYNFSSAFKHEDSYQECPQYLQENGQNVGCRIPLYENGQFDAFYTKLSMGGNLTVERYYGDLKDRVKINPPFNLSVDWTANGDLCLYWVNNVTKPHCLEFMVRYQRGSDQWQVSTKQKSTSYCIPLVPMGVNFTFQVMSRMGNLCGLSEFWSEWSAPLQWGNYTGSISAPLSQPWWHLWLSVLGVIVLIALAVLLYYIERVKVLILPVVPDPSKNLQDLFYKHNGNVESWVHVSGELKKAFDTDYTESPCVVCEPSPTLKSKECDKPVQHSA
ncbi:interleukin 2 receptor, gamma b [Colossoma macropomum]|uniref:interleukin 2 receptor, gamma b n=1 Tax=Colossoma macropomum TaxID=42526 RepID=UPI001864A186|nr:interleukin 2 receptor, gamma b [Colossoma macropomum]